MKGREEFMNPCEITAFVTAAANTLAGCYTDSELAVLAAVFTQLGDTLDTLLAARMLCNNK